MHRIKNIFQILFIFCFNALSAQEFLIDSYNKHDGLIQSSVADIIQDENGLIWFYTEQGISAFDGLNFHNYVDSVELFDSWLVGAHADSLGNIYIINIAGQVWQWNKKKFDRVISPPNTAITDINITNDNELIVGTGNAGLFILRGGQWINLTESEGLYSNNIQSITNTNGYTIAATSKGLIKIVKDKPVRVFPYDDINVVKVLIDADGNLLLGAISGLFLFNGRLNKIADNVSMIEDLCMDKFDNIWIATRAGLFRINTQGLTESILPNSDFRTILIDRENIVWAGTIGKGVFKIRYNPFLHLTEANRFPLRMTFPMHEDSNGNIWIGTDHGLIKRTDGNWRILEELINKRHIDIIEDHDKRIWILTRDEVYKYANGGLNLICNNPKESIYVLVFPDVLLNKLTEELYIFCINADLRSYCKNK
ncbi:two-component regulator propeller domain-containing protein [Bacteroidota bacterium]